MRGGIATPNPKKLKLKWEKMQIVSRKKVPRRWKNSLVECPRGRGGGKHATGGKKLEPCKGNEL